MHRTLVALIVVAWAGMFPHPAGAESTWFPMHVGNAWDYVSPGDRNEGTTFTRTMTFGGREVFVLTFAPSVKNLGLENYWSAAPDGDVLLSGFFRSADDFGLLYDPPLPLIDAPLTLGKTWSHTTNITLLPEMRNLGPTTFAFEVFTEGFVAVPAGVFFAYGIGQTLPGAVLERARDLDPSGRRLDAGGAATDWWSEGVGRIQYESDDFYRLSNFSFPTPTTAKTWGAVKALYRPPGHAGRGPE